MSDEAPSRDPEPRLGRRTAVRLAIVSVVLVCAAAGLLAVVTASPAATQGARLTTVNARPAAGFTLPSVRPDQSPVTLADADGHPVLLSFFASWCPGCQQELHTMADVKQMAGGTVQIIGIDVNDTTGSARALLQRDGLAYPVGADGGQVSSDYRLVGLPTTIFLDARHRVVGQVIGPLTAATAKSWIRQLGGS